MWEHNFFGPLEAPAEPFGPAARYVDQELDLRLELRDGEKHLRAIRPDGTLLFEGPVQTDEQRAGLTDVLRLRLDQLDQRWPVQAEPVMFELGSGAI